MNIESQSFQEQQFSCWSSSQGKLCGLDSDFPLLVLYGTKTLFQKKVKSGRQVLKTSKILLFLYSLTKINFKKGRIIGAKLGHDMNTYTEKNISEFFLFFIGILPQGIENRKIYCLKGSIYYCESEITG